MSQRAQCNEVFSRRFVLPNRRAEIEAAQRQVVEALQQRQYDAESCFAVRVALGEALANAFKHGNQDDAEKAVTLECRIDATRVTLEVEDEGEGFDPSSIPNPTEPENLDIPAGRGIAMMRSYMTEVSFVPPGNRVRLTYVRPGDD